MATDTLLKQAISEAYRRACVTREPQRVYLAYSAYHVKPAHLPYDGQHIATVKPRNPSP